MPRVIKMIPIGELAPDQRGVDSLEMNRTTGLIPVHGAYRSVARMLELSSFDTPHPVNGSHVHLITPERSNQSATPIDDRGGWTSSWELFGSAAEYAPEGADPTHGWWRVNWPVNEQTGMRAIRDAVHNAWFGLSPDLEDPNIDTGHFLRMRFRAVHGELFTDWLIEMALLDGGFSEYHSFVFDKADHGDYGDGWRTVEQEIPSGVIATITDFGDLQLLLNPGVTGIPAGPIGVPIVGLVNESPELWEADPEIEDENETPRYTYLQDADTATFLKIGGEGEKSIEILCADVVEPETDAEEQNWEMTATVISPAEDVDVTLELLELGEVIATGQDTVTGGAGPVVVTVPILEAEVEAIEDFNVLSVRATVNAGGGAATTLRPNGTISSGFGGWDYIGGSTLHAVVGDDDLDTYARTISVTAENSGFRVNIPDPGTNPPDGTKVTVKAMVTQVVGRNDWTLKFGSGGTTHFTVKKSNVTGVEKLVEGSSSPSGVDWSDAWIDVGLGPIGTEKQASCLETWVEVEGSTVDFEVRLAELELKAQTEFARIEVCFLEYDLPISKPLTPGDRPQIYTGTNDAIYEVSNQTGFIDVSKTADGSYGALVAPPTVWRFCSWGNRMIATNGSDPVQWQEEGGERFVDLLDNAVEPETEIFTARFCAVARDHLFLANCLHPTDPVIGEYTVWWSAINNPRLFKYLDLTTMSDYQPIVTTPGAITGLTGGEFATIFKRTSTYRASFVGPPLIWDIQVASYLEGTMYPESIVQIDRDHFFMGNGGFRHLPFGGAVRPIGDNKITKMFTDRIYEDRALLQFYSEDLKEIDNSLVGCYDAWSRLIFWLYRGVADNAYENRAVIIYNPWEDRWSTMDLELPYSHTNALPTLPMDDRTLTRGWIGFGNRSNQITYERSLSPESYPVHYQTLRMSSAILADARGMVIKVHGIRPIVTIEEARDTLNFSSPVIEATMAGSTDVMLTCDRVEYTVSTGSDNENRNGWLMFDKPLVGEYFLLDIRYSEVEDELLRELIAFEVDCEIGSRN